MKEHPEYSGIQMTSFTISFMCRSIFNNLNTKLKFRKSSMRQINKKNSLHMEHIFHKTLLVNFQYRFYSRMHETKFNLKGSSQV